MNKVVLPGGSTVWSFTSGHSSHLLVSGGESVLIDCHDPGLGEEITSLGLPLPRLILHTHVQPWHCREGGLFPGAKVRVHRKNETLAFAPDSVCEPVAFGQEPHNVACQTEFPPEVPLLSGGMTGGSFEVGESFRCGEVELKVIDLAFHGRHAVGFVITNAQGQALGIFIGDLFRKGPFLVDASSLIENYVENRLPRLPGLLDQLAAYGNLPLFPAAGVPIPKGGHEIAILKARITEYLNSQRPPLPASNRPMPVDIGTPGRLRKIGEGIYNMGNGGNTIALVDSEGHGVLIDPGPCDYENAHRDRDFVNDLVTLETLAGLKTVDFVLLTHFQRDCVDKVHRVRERYPECKIATGVAVAEVLEFPERFNNSARFPWRGQEATKVPVDLRLEIGANLSWRGSSIKVVHLPGRATVHCGFVLSFAGETLAITGDVVRSNGEADSLSLMISSHSIPAAAEAILGTYRRLVRSAVDLNLGARGSWFRDCVAVYEQSIRRISAQHAALERLFIPGGVGEAFLPPWIGEAQEAVPGVQSQTEDAMEPISIRPTFGEGRTFSLKKAWPASSK